MFPNHKLGSRGRSYISWNYHSIYKNDIEYVIKKFGVNGRNWSNRQGYTLVDGKFEKVTQDVKWKYKILKYVRKFLLRVTSLYTSY